MHTIKEISVAYFWTLFVINFQGLGSILDWLTPLPSISCKASSTCASQLYPIITIILFNFILAIAIMYEIHSQNVELLNLIVVFNLGTDLQLHLKAPHKSTFPEYFWAISTIKKCYFTRDPMHLTNPWLLLVIIVQTLTLITWTLWPQLFNK